MQTVHRIPNPVLALMAGTILSGATIAALAVAVSFVVTGNFLFEGEVQSTGGEAVTCGVSKPYRPCFDLPPKN